MGKRLDLSALAVAGLLALCIVQVPPAGGALPRGHALPAQGLTQARAPWQVAEANGKKYHRGDNVPLYANKVRNLVCQCLRGVLLPLRLCYVHGSWQ